MLIVDLLADIAEVIIDYFCNSLMDKVVEKFTKKRADKKNAEKDT